jgi:hypothetical protein
MTALLTIMVDENDDAVKLQLYNQPDETTRPAKDVIDTGSVLVVKEPYFKIMSDGEYGLRVDHVSDVVFVDRDGLMLPKAWRVQKPKRSVEVLKAKGNDYIAKSKYWDAIEMYVHGKSTSCTS